MLSKAAAEFRRFMRNCFYLRRVFNETQYILNDLSQSNAFPEENLKDLLVNNEKLDSLCKVLKSNPIILILGENCSAKALLINALFDQTVLPLNGSNWRWIRFSYGRTKRTHLSLGGEFEIVEPPLKNKKAWTIVPEEDLHCSPEEAVGPIMVLEVELPASVLRDNVHIVISPDCDLSSIQDVWIKGLENVLPVIFYGVVSDTLGEKNIAELRKFKDMYPDLPILFINVAETSETLSIELTESERDDINDRPEEDHVETIEVHDYQFNQLWRQLVSLGFLTVTDGMCSEDRGKLCINQYASSNLISIHDSDDLINSFIQMSLKYHTIQTSALLSDLHNHCLRKFILYAFDMAREIQITPKRIAYAQKKENELYRSLVTIANEKHTEITQLIVAKLNTLRANIGDIVEEYFSSVSNKNTSRSSIRLTIDEIQQLVLRKLSESVAAELVTSMDCLQENVIGTLQRCLESLERNFNELERNLTASDAVKQIMNAAYNVDLKTSTSFSFVHTVLERVRLFMRNFTFSLNVTPYNQNTSQWRKQVAIDVIDSLNAHRLARSISSQFQERVCASHELFQSAIKSLENHYCGKLEQTEEYRIAIRKYHAPKFARLALESTSMCDLVRWGLPVQGREIGRGQYGVVFACEAWGGVNPCAVKSVVPPDERHWNDLAMEFYYTRSIPEHPRIVRLKGSIVDHSYGAGGSSAVLLIMERMNRDLFNGIRSGLPWKVRLQIAMDVAEGIRYLHSQGLVHRDIKLKNVLLDGKDRAKLTDLGFCIPEAMMSGSIVGTPVHMAPELLSGRYDSSVDVYAFGILFWFLCAGHTHIPQTYEKIESKEQLWTIVRKGTRPEHLPHFHDLCWELMEQCWADEPALRPLLGVVQPKLAEIMAITCGGSRQNGVRASANGRVAIK